MTRRNRKGAVALGPGAASLIFIFVILALSMLSMLALMNGRNDAGLSERSARVMEEVYALNVRAEESRAELDTILADCAAHAEDEQAYLSAIDAALPDRMERADRSISWTESDGMRNLHCKVEIQPPGQTSRSSWTEHTLIAVSAEGAEEEGLVEFD